MIGGRADHFPGVSARHERVWIAFGFAFVLLVIYLSVTPDPVRAPTVENFKTGHIIAYLWLMLWFAQVRRSPATRLVIGLLIVALGVGLEYVQRYVGRDFAYSDMVDDAIGVAAGYLLALTPLGSLFARWEQRK
ncbi:MAG TPA: VanZ family protein [Usitatibacter sp.]|nr:VanZ family protein [Usitatibacter sp.]